MASGGHFSLPQSRNAKQLATSSSSHAHGEPCDSMDHGPWLLTANNLDLHASATEVRLSKKQRNRNKARTAAALESPILSESSPRVPCQKSSTTLFACSKFSPVPRNEAGDSVTRQWAPRSDYGDADSDTEESSAQKFHPYNRKGESLTNGTVVKKAAKDSFGRSNKQDNTNKLPNTSVIVERLLHLRDCISQVTSIMQNLEKSDEPCTREQMGRLDEMLNQLRHEEQEHLELLQQVLAAREMKSSQRDQDVAAASSGGLTENAASSPKKIKQEEVQVIPQESESEEDNQLENHHNHVLQDVITSREKLTAIKEQQTALLTLQKRAEDRLAEAKAFHEHIMETTLPSACDWNGSEIQNDTGSYGDFNDELDQDDQNLEVIPQPPPRKGNKSDDRNKRAPTIDMRFRFLKEVADNRELAQVMTAAEENITQDEKTAERHRQQLENKLRKLQEKKHQMDRLLAEISSLQTISDQNSKPRNPSSNKERVGHNSENSAVEDAQQLLDVVDSQDNLRKLDDIKETFKQLKEIAGNLNTVGTAEPNNSEAYQRDIQRNHRRVQSQKPKEKSPQRKQGSVKSDNIKKENLFATSFPARRHYEAEGRANEDGDAAQAAAPGSVALNGVIDDETEIQEKVQKLQDAKSKLQKLQALLGTMQQLQQNGEPVPNELLGMLSSMRDYSSEDDGDKNVSHDNPNDRMQNDMSRLEEVEEKMERQQIDLEKLIEERSRLLTMKEQLTRLQQQFPSIISKNNHQRSSGEGGSSARREKQTRQKNLLSARETKRVGSGQNPNLFQHNLSLNSEDPNRNVEPPAQVANAVQKDVNSRAPNRLSNPLNLPRSRANTYPNSAEQCRDPGMVAFMEELDQSLSLRDELQKQKTVLEELLKQEQKKQMGFFQNQDIPSQSGSSDKSELIEGSSSVLAPDTTVAATWGGSSTQDNLNDEVEEQLESLDEDEGRDSGSADENLTESRLQSLAQGSGSIGQQSENSANRKGNCQLNRTFNYRRSLLNQWRRNIQPNSSHKSDEHVPFQVSSQEMHTLPPTDLNPSDLPVSDGSCMTKHLQQQLQQTSNLCQSVLRDQNNLTSILMAHSGSTQHLANQPDFFRQYNYQLYQQQLLLNLSHCYHMLYLQQLEIQHLNQCLEQQHPDSENGDHHPSIRNSPSTANEELSFRQWYMPPWLGPMPLMPAAISPTFLPSSYPPFGASPAPNNPITYMPNACHSPNNASNHDGRIANEMLNNQVPPGTRANNFLDNFRSYSRQNLLSTTPKSNEHLVNSTAPLSRSPRLSHSHSTPRGNGRMQSANTIPQNALGRSSAPNLATQNSGARPRVKRPNLNQEHVSDGAATDRARRIPACLNLFEMPESTVSSTTRCPPTIAFPNPPISSLSTVNISLPHHPNQTPRPTDLNSGTDPLHQETVSGEIQNLIQKQENNMEFLIELFKQLQLMCSDSQRSKLLSAVQEITGISNEDTSSHSKTKMEARAKNHLTCSPSDQFVHKSGQADVDRSVQLPESGSPGIRQDDQSPVESSSSSASWTKSPVTSSMAQKKISSKQHSSSIHQSFGSGVQESGGIRRHSIDADVSAFLENHRYEECTVQLQAQLCNCVLQTLPQHPLRFFRSQLLQGLQHVLSKYQGQRICDCENEILVDVNEVVKTELSIHKHMSRQRRERSTEHDRNEASLRIHEAATGGFSETHKDLKVPYSEDNVEADGEDGPGYPSGENFVPETLKAVSRNAYLDLQPDHLDDVRAAPDGIAAAAPPLSLPEEESGYDCDAEGETEPEVEAETEADDTQDLAEADQSSDRPCVRENAVGAAASSHTRGSLSPTESSDPVYRHHLMNGDVMHPEDLGSAADFIHGQVSAAEGDGDELMLDDIPTKLAPLSQDELQRHINEENAANSLIQDILADNYGAELLGDEDNIREPGAL